MKPEAILCLYNQNIHSAKGWGVNTPGISLHAFPLSWATDQILGKATLKRSWEKPMAILILVITSKNKKTSLNFKSKNMPVHSVWYTINQWLCSLNLCYTTNSLGRFLTTIFLVNTLIIWKKKSVIINPCPVYFSRTWTNYKEQDHPQIKLIFLGYYLELWVYWCHKHHLMTVG